MNELHDASALWNQVLERLRRDLPSHQFDAYVKVANVLSLQGDRLTVAVPNEFVQAKWYGPLIARMNERLLEIAGRPVIVSCVVVEPEPAPLRSTIPPPPSTPEEAGYPASGSWEISNLSPSYRMEDYIVGPVNRLAYLAAQAVVRGLGTTYNPFFISGTVGVGKTHLMQAIGHQVLDVNSRVRVMYATAEIFTNEFYEALQRGSTKDFQRKYRTVDLLLLDDVQFFEKKDAMQEAFFHTFNELYQKNKQIVLTSDRPPKLLAGLQERLVSRFESGLTVEVEPPDFETRVLILERIARRYAIAFPQEAIHRLADRALSNVRELEGAFKRVTASSSLLDLPITVSLVDEVLEIYLTERTKKTLTVDLIIDTVAQYYELKREDLFAKRQTRAVSGPRQVAMYLIHELMGKTLKDIAHLFGKKDHTTILYACEKVRKTLETGDANAEGVNLIKIKLREITRETTS